MAILDEIKNEILKNSELDGNEKICLISLLCSSDLDNLDELAELMGVTRNTSQMTVRSLRLKGYLKDSQIEADEAEISALRKLMSKEKPTISDSGHYEESPYSRRDTAEEISSDERYALYRDSTYHKDSNEAELTRRERAEKLSKALEFSPESATKNTYKSRAAALYKKDSNVAKAAKKIKDVNILDYDADDVMESLENAESRVPVAKSAHDIGPSPNRGSKNRTIGKAEKAIDKAEKPLSPEDRVMNLVEESITRSEAAIILGFAGGDYGKVEKTYKRIRGTQIKDKVDALVKLLQADDTPN